MTDQGPVYSVSLARTDADLRAAQRLRYDVFIREMGARGGADVDHDAGLERDRFDAFCDHMIVRDETRGQVAGVYRLMRAELAEHAGQYYSESEYDLSALFDSGRRLLELGRTCLHPAYRGGTAMLHMWTGLASYVHKYDIELLFGVASFPGTNLEVLAAPLSVLHHRHLAPQELRVRAKPDGRAPIDLIDEAQLDRRAAMVATPALIKGYLRLGAVVGDGAFVDYEFNTTDVCLILDTARLNQMQRRIYDLDPAQ